MNDDRTYIVICIYSIKLYVYIYYIVVCIYHTNLNIDLEDGPLDLTLPVAINSLAWTLPLFEYQSCIC